MSILVFGSLNKDHVYTVEDIVKPGETIFSFDYQIFWGGKGLNQSIALSRAGAPVSFACKVAQEDSIELKDLFKTYTLPDTYLSCSGSITGHTIIQIDQEGQNCILVYPGANHEIGHKWVGEVLENLKEGDMILLQNEISNNAHIIKEAHKRGIKTAFNPSPFPKDFEKLPLDMIDLFFVNELECQEMTGVCDVEKMGDAMLSKYPDAKIVLTLGKRGAVYIDKNTRRFQPAYTVNAVDTTAAGDTFTGFFLAEYMKSGDISLALETAAKAAAIAVTVKGAANSIPSLAEVTEREFK